MRGSTPWRSNSQRKLVAPTRVGAARDRQRRVVGVGHHHVAGDPHERNVLRILAEPRPLRPVAVGDDTHGRAQRDAHDVDVVRRRPLGVVGKRGAVPERRVRLLHRAQNHRHLLELIILPLEGELVHDQAFEQQLEGLVVHVGGLREIEAVGPASRTAIRRARRRAGSARRSSGRACRLPRSGAADGRTAADRPAARSAASGWRAQPAPGTSRARRRSRAASNGARRDGSRRCRRDHRLRPARADRHKASRAGRPHRPYGRTRRISSKSPEAELMDVMPGPRLELRGLVRAPTP